MTTGNRKSRSALRTLFAGALAAAAVLAGPLAGQAADRFITVASTTSTDNSGLFRHILPKFTAKTGIEVRVVAVGTGAALELGRRGDVDVVLVHARAAEERFVAEGYGVERHDVMYNDFVIVGPKDDPAEIDGMKDAAAALAKIAARQAPFSSRGDNSGTHKAELRLWKAAGIDPRPSSGEWYYETGSGMGATLNIAAARGTYTLTDRGTWLAFENKGNLEILVAGDRRLFNPYGVILVNPERHPHVKEKAARTFIGWLTGPEGQQAIAGFRLNGEQLFHPSATKEGS